jgi:hypothetical protein
MLIKAQKTLDGANQRIQEVVLHSTQAGLAQRVAKKEDIAIQNQEGNSIFVLIK